MRSLCKYTGVRGTVYNLVRNKYYEEVDGRYELVAQDVLEATIDAGGNISLVSKDTDGAKLDEVYVVDGVHYSRIVGEDWEVDEDFGYWPGLEPDPEETPGPVGNTGGPADGEGDGPGDDSGDAGPTGQVAETPAVSNTLCGHPLDTLTDFKDYGTKTLNGITVRHVAATEKSHPSAKFQAIFEFWVDTGGKLVQTKETQLWPAVFEYPAKRNESVTTFPERDPAILVPVPEGAPTPGP